MKKQRSEKWNIARMMPPRMHSIPGEDFAIERSEVVQWLMSRPEIMQIVFDAVKGHGDIVYDYATGTWRGADYGH